MCRQTRRASTLHAKWIFADFIRRLRNSMVCAAGTSPSRSWILRMSLIILTIVGALLWLVIRDLRLRAYWGVTLPNISTIQRFQRKNGTLMTPGGCFGQSDLFEEFYNNNSTISFMDKYRAQCRGERLVFVSILGDVRDLGFGSYLNNAANVYVVTTEPVNRARWRFQLVVHDWDYEPLSSFFTDFAADTACPLFAQPTDDEYTRLFGDVQANFLEKGFFTRSLTITATKPVKIITNSREFYQLLYGLQKLHVDMDAIFYEKSSLIKAIWQPNKLFKELLRKLWKCLVDSSSRFTAVHVRRSDKIATGEANAISLSTYADAVHNICRKDPRNCPRNVFVMSDEEGVYDELRTHLWSSFQVYNLSDLLEKSGLDPGEYLILSAEILKHVLPPAHREFWQIHTREIIIGLTLMGMSDHLICTFSSNMCRFAALLRGHPSRGIHSLDVKTWNPW